VDQPKELAELALTVDGRHYPLLVGAIRTNKAAVVPLLKAELARSAGPTWAVDGGGWALAAVAGCPVALDALDPDPVLAERAKRRGHAAAVLVSLGEAEGVWPVFVFPQDGDPTARS
jgi:hypothetical protein